MLIRVCDLETTGLPPDAAICQIGWCDVLVEGSTVMISMPSTMLVNPGRPIPPESRAVHHISDRDVKDAPSIEFGIKQLMDGPPDAFAAHNAIFERNFFGGGDIPWVCTRKTAMRVWPAAPNFQNQTLRYFLGVDEDEGFEPWQAVPVHAAGPDAFVTAHLLKRALAIAEVGQMIEWTSQPSLLPGAIQFGKHKGTPWPQVDVSYLEWLTRQADMDSDVKFTAQHWLTRRRTDDR